MVVVNPPTVNLRGVCLDLVVCVADTMPCVGMGPKQVPLVRSYSEVTPEHDYCSHCEQTNSQSHIAQT